MKFGVGVGVRCRCFSLSKSYSEGFFSGEGVGVGVAKILSESIKVGLMACFTGPQQIGRCASKVTDLRNDPQRLFLCKD